MVSKKNTRLKIISMWREYVEILVRVVKKLYPETRICLVGGVAENRLTIDSDIDVVIVFKEKPSFEKAVDVRTRIWEEAEKEGLPIYAPIELHIIGEEDLGRYGKTICID